MSDSTQFENTLERLLEESGNSVASRPHFYRELLLSNVLIIPHGAIEEDDDPGRQTATLKMAAISHEGVDYVPFFISAKFLPRETRYLSLPAKTFFEITKGAHLILNPGAQFGKTFSPEEVEKLLTGKMFEVEKEFQVKNSAQVIIGNPKEIPDRLLPELSRFFQSENSVLRAWLGWYHNPELEKEPGYLLAIETARSVDFRALAGRVSLVLKEVGTQGRYCDVVQYNGQGITGYFRSSHPFYAKPFWVRLKGGLLGW